MLGPRVVKAGPGRPRGVVLTSQEFAALAALASAASMPPERIEAARLALVEQLPTPEIAERLDLDRKTVNQAVAALLKFGRSERPKRTQSRQMLTAVEFENLMPLLMAKGTSERRITAARLALVDRLPASEIAERLGLKSRQSVSLAKAVVWDLYQTMIEHTAPPVLPPGWVQLTIAAPAEMADQFRRNVEMARRALEKKPDHKGRV